MLEKVAWARSEEERLRIRQDKEVPIIDELIKAIKQRLMEGAILPKSKFREALGYFCGLIPYMKNYTQHAFARLDNNVAERAIRPLAIGRKNLRVRQPYSRCRWIMFVPRSSRDVLSQSHFSCPRGLRRVCRVGVSHMV